MRDLAERLVKFRWGQGSVRALVYGAQYLVFTTILSFPLNAYQGFFREQKYGSTAQRLQRNPHVSRTLYIREFNLMQRVADGPPTAFARSQREVKQSEASVRLRHSRTCQ